MSNRLPLPSDGKVPNCTCDQMRASSIVPFTGTCDACTWFRLGVSPPAHASFMSGFGSVGRRSRLNSGIDDLEEEVQWSLNLGTCDEDLDRLERARVPAPDVVRMMRGGLDDSFEMDPSPSSSSVGSAGGSIFSASSSASSTPFVPSSQLTRSDHTSNSSPSSIVSSSPPLISASPPNTAPVFSSFPFSSSTSASVRMPSSLSAALSSEEAHSHTFNPRDHLGSSPGNVIFSNQPPSTGAVAATANRVPSAFVRPLNLNGLPREDAEVDNTNQSSSERRRRFETSPRSAFSVPIPSPGVVLASSPTLSGSTQCESNCGSNGSLSPVYFSDHSRRSSLPLSESLSESDRERSGSSTSPDSELLSSL